MWFAANTTGGGDSFTQLMAGGVLAVLVIREVLNFLKNQKAKTNGSGDCICSKLSLIDWQRLDRRIESMIHIIQATDDDKVPMVYVRRSFESAVTRLVSNVENQTKATEDIARALEAFEKVMKRSLGE